MLLLRHATKASRNIFFFGGGGGWGEGAYSRVSADYFFGLPGCTYLKVGAHSNEYGF